jgi:flagellar motor switch/type III secretory pathway protein FliN
MMGTMPQGISVSAYPWGSLRRVPKVAARALGELQRRLSTDSITPRLTEALSAWLGEPVCIQGYELRAVSGEPQGRSACLRLRLAASSADISLVLDPRLVARLVGFALNRDVSLYDPLAPIEPPLLGAMAAIAAKIIDDSKIGIDVSFASEPLDTLDAQSIQIDSVLHIGSTAYPCLLRVALEWLSRRDEAKLPPLNSLGALPLALSLVVGESLVRRDELARLAPGTAFLTGAGLWVDDSRVGRGVLIAPNSEAGIAVTLQPGGKIVLGDQAVTLNHDDANPKTASDATNLTETLLEAPVVLRVELGTVSLPAKQWAMLRAGDIIETGQPLSSEVTLRVAGQVLAKGELLNVEGELGVRITKLLVGEER